MSPLSVRRRWSLLALMLGGVGCASSKPEPMTDPEVSLDLPLDGALLAGDVALLATARDDVAVERVEFYLGSEPVGVDSAEPYEAIL